MGKIELPKADKKGEDKKPIASSDNVQEQRKKKGLESVLHPGQTKEEEERDANARKKKSLQIKRSRIRSRPLLQSSAQAAKSQQVQNTEEKKDLLRQRPRKSKCSKSERTQKRLR